MYNRKYASGLFLFLFCVLTTNIWANGHLKPPANRLIYFCKCTTPNAQGICHAFKKDGKTSSVGATPVALTLPDGWVIQPINCSNKQQYTLTAGAIFFSGKKIFAQYDKLSSPLSMVGYVYHVTPNLPFTQTDYSLTVIKNQAIKNVVLKKGRWECGNGNKPTACSEDFLTARCVSHSDCFFSTSDI